MPESKSKLTLGKAVGASSDIIGKYERANRQARYCHIRHALQTRAS